MRLNQNPESVAIGLRGAPFLAMGDLRRRLPACALGPVSPIGDIEEVKNFAEDRHISRSAPAVKPLDRTPSLDQVQLERTFN